MDEVKKARRNKSVDRSGWKRKAKNGGGTARGEEKERGCSLCVVFRARVRLVNRCSLCWHANGMS